MLNELESSLLAEATELKAGRYAVHPVGTVGTCGQVKRGFTFVCWQVRYVNAANESEAISKARAGRFKELELYR